MRRLIAVALCSAPLALGAGGAAIAGSGAIEAPQSQPRVCFPRADWGAKPALRPCARITRVYEDGSVKLAVSDASGTVRWSVGVGARDR